MLGTRDLPAFLLAAVALIVIPGPSVIFIVSRALALGRRAALATVVGNTLGLAVQMAMVAVCVGVVIAASADVFGVIKLLGAGYLIVLGLRVIRQRRKLAALVDAATVPRATRRIITEGFVVGVTNPKALLIFSAVLPRFVNRNAGHVPLQLGFLGAVCVATAVCSDSAWALVSSQVRGWLYRSPRRLELAGGASGVTMIGLGIGLAASGRKS